MQLLEVLVAVAILGVVGLAVLGAYAQSAKEVRTTSDYTIAFLLSQKVVEESIQSTLENPHASAMLAELSEQPSTAIKDGGTPYFNVLEDSVEPYGQLVSRKDLAVDQRDPGLYRLYRDYSLGVVAVDQPVMELPGTPSHLQKVTVALDWPGPNGERSFDFPIAIPKAVVTPRSRPEITTDPDTLEAAIRKLLYARVAGPDLTSVVSTTGAQMTVVRDLGSICVVIDDMLDKLNQLDDQINVGLAELRTPPANPYLLAALRVKVAKAYERRAALSWQALLFCREPAWRLASSLTRASLGTRLPDRSLTFGLLSMGSRLMWEMRRSTGSALAMYSSARQPLPTFGVTPYWQFLLERKVLELSKLTVLMFEPGDVAFTRAWILAMERIYGNRNRFVQAYLEREKKLATTVDTLRAEYPELRDRTNEVTDVVRALDALRARVLREL